LKKGAINKKSLYTRRNIVYQFYSSLNPTTEFKYFLDELLEPINLSTEVEDVVDVDFYLSSVSFNVFLSFINTLEVVIKQMGTLLSQHLPQLSTILIQGILRLSGNFIKSAK
jgi:hypothetical protein